MTYLKKIIIQTLLLFALLTPHFGLAQDSHIDASSRGTAALQATEPKATDETFVAGSGEDLDLYLFRKDVPGGKLRFNIPITRYYGVASTPADIQDLINKKLLPEKVKLTLRIYDVDHNSTLDGDGDGRPDPERDYVYVNNHLVTNASGNGIFLQSGNNTWSIMTFDIPTTWLLFPTQQGTDNTKPTPRNNEIAIDIDVTTPGYWAIECDWGSIFIKSPLRPVLLVHGYNANAANTWNTFAGFFNQDKIPYRKPEFGPKASIANNAALVGTEMNRTKNIFGVDKVNIMVHSKGGLDSRLAIGNRNDVENLIQLGTPNHGSELADLIYNPFSSDAVSQLRTTWIRDHFNYIPKHHGWGIYSYFPRYVVNPNVKYRTLAGTAGGFRAGVFPGQHDGAVSTRSATYPWRGTIWYPTVANVDAMRAVNHTNLHEVREIYQWGINQIRPGFFPEIPPAQQLEMMFASFLSPEQINLSPPIDSTQVIKKISHDIASSETITDSILISDADTVAFVVATTDASLQVVLVDPNGSIIDSAVAALRADIEYQMDVNEWGQFIVYKVAIPIVGTWQVRTTALVGANYSTTATVVGTAFLLSGTNKYSYSINEPIQVTAEFKRNLIPLLNSTVSATIILSDVSSSTITLFDDGLHEDLSANDGFYSNSFPGFSTTGFADIIVNAQKDSILRQASLILLIAPASAQLSGTYGEIPVDSDGDGLYNSLDITVEINVTETGHYSLSGILTDNSGNSIQSQTYSTLIDGLPELSPGVHNINFSFDGQMIRQHGVNGPYFLRNLFVIKDAGLSMTVDFKDSAYATSPYSAMQFQKPLLSLTGNNSESTEDIDSDGKIDYLNINFDVDITRSGFYEVNAQLVDLAGDGIDWDVQSSFLSSGTSTMQLKFEGRNISRHSVDGPYVLTDLSIFDATNNYLATFTEVETTEAYSASIFEGSRISGRVTKKYNGDGIAGAFILVSGPTPTVDSTDSNGYFTIDGLDDGIYSVRAQATGYIDSDPVDVTLPPDTTVDFALQRDFSLDTYRSFKPDSIAHDRDNKGMVGKFVKRTPDKVDFEILLVVDSNNTTDLHIEFSHAILTTFPFGTIPPSTATPAETKLKKWDFVFTPLLNQGDTVYVYGYGNKGKVQKIPKYYWTRNGEQIGVKKKDPVFTRNQPKLPMPNRVNALYETMVNKGTAYGPNGFIIGVNRKLTSPDSGMYYGWLQTNNYGALLKTLIVKRTGQMHEGTPRGFDHLTGKTNDLVKHQKSLPPNKFDNKLLAELVALKVNITASAMGITPNGFGELLYYAIPDTNTMSGKMVREIAEYGDNLMMGQYDATDGKKLFATPEEFAILDSIVRLINSAFEGAVDTSEFGAALHFKGTTQLKDVPFLRANPDVIPAVITPIASTEPEVPLAYSLYQNYPNPFNPTTTISFDLPEDALVTLKVYNMLGQEVATLLDKEELYEGTQEIEFSANSLASGVYFYRLVAKTINNDDEEISETYINIKKMILLK